MAEEIWKLVPGIDIPLEVSDLGRARRPGGRILRGDLKDGYRRIKLTSKGKRRYFLLHLMVLRAFVGPVPMGMEAAHWNGDRADASLKNLRYDTRKGNHADKIRHGTSNRGIRHGMSKLDLAAVNEIRSTYRRRVPGRDSVALAAKFGVTPGCIQSVVNRKNWAWAT